MKAFAIFVFIFTFLAINALIGSLCWPYVINTWLTYAGKTPDILWYQGMLIGFVPGVGQLALPLCNNMASYDVLKLKEKQCTLRKKMIW